MTIDVEKRDCWDYIQEDLKELLIQSVLLMRTVSEWEKGLPKGRSEFHDYAFIVFPAAKAYEGFLKTLFFDMKLITEEDFYGKRFRIGKALNPALEKQLMESEGVYHKIVEFNENGKLADRLWETWRACRNLTFHWFPNEKNAISLSEAEDRIEMIFDTMDEAYRVFKPEKQNSYLKDGV